MRPGTTATRTTSTGPDHAKACRDLDARSTRITPRSPTSRSKATTSPTSASTATMSFEWTPNGRERPVRNAEAGTSSTSAGSKVGRARSVEVVRSKAGQGPFPDPAASLKKHPPGRRKADGEGCWASSVPNHMHQHAAVRINRRIRDIDPRDTDPRHSGAGPGHRRRRCRFHSGRQRDPRFPRRRAEGRGRRRRRCRHR